MADLIVEVSTAKSTRKRIRDGKVGLDTSGKLVGNFESETSRPIGGSLDKEAGFDWLIERDPGVHVEDPEVTPPYSFLFFEQPQVLLPLPFLRAFGIERAPPDIEPRNVCDQAAESVLRDPPIPGWPADWAHGGFVLSACKWNGADFPNQIPSARSRERSMFCPMNPDESRLFFP
jgi:hypothetical protein